MRTGQRGILYRGLSQLEPRGITMTLTAGRNIFQSAIGATALALFFIVPALLGCNLHKSDSIFVACTPSSEGVLWDRVRDQDGCAAGRRLFLAARHQIGY